MDTTKSMIAQLTSILSIAAISFLTYKHMCAGQDGIVVVEAIAIIGALGGVASPLLTLLLQNKQTQALTKIASQDTEVKK